MNKYYTSHITNFLKNYKSLHPDVENLQMDSRAIFWKKNSDFELEQQFQSAKVPRKSYVYQDE